MKKYLFFSIILFSIGTQLHSQGCILSQGAGGSCSLNGMQQNKKWEFNANLRAFRSHRHFVGTVEQKERKENKTEVINNTWSWDFTLARTLDAHWTVMMNLPITFNHRSSLYEHYGNTSTSPLARRSTRSFGMGDIRFAAYLSLGNQREHLKHNLRIGLGIKLPTGDYRYTDYFYRPTPSGRDSAVLGPVDQSIQLGDGGTGITVEVRGYQTLTRTISAYAEGFYLINPREQNGVSTARGGIPTATVVRYFTNTMSVADIYVGRIGLNYMSHGFSAGAGLRLDGVPSSDLIGGDKGFRRPGYTLALEPTLNWIFNNKAIYINAPIAVRRNRVQSYADKLRTMDSGTRVQGDASFADFSVNVGLNIRF